MKLLSEFSHRWPETEWKKVYFINDREILHAYYEEPITRDRFLNETNEEYRAAMYEIIEHRKQGGMLELLDAYIADSVTLVHTGGEMETLEYYKTKDEFNGETDINGKSPAQLAWLKMICPSTSTQYLVPVDSGFKTAEDAAKSTRPSFIPLNVPYFWTFRT